MRHIGIVLLLCFLFLLVQNNIYNKPILHNSDKDNYLKYRELMVKNQIRDRGIVNKKILNAFLSVKREKFILLKDPKTIYSDRKLPIGEGQSVSPAYITAIIVSVISSPKYNKILDIGTGSGYQAAILASLGKKVFTVEIKKKLSINAKNRIEKQGYKNIRFKVGDGYKGWEEFAPFDGIILTTSLNHIPAELIKQLSIGGRMIIPLAYSRNVQELVLIEKIDKDNIKKINLIPVKFIPIIRNNS